MYILGKGIDLILFSGLLLISVVMISITYVLVFSMVEWTIQKLKR